MPHDWISVRGARVHNLRNIDVDLPSERLVVITGLSRVGQVVAGLRHALRRGPAAVRRVAVGLRPPVPRADGEARRRSDRRAVAGDLHRAEDDRQQPAFDGGHGHRDLRLPAPALREHRHAALPELRPRHRQPVARADHRPGDDLSAGRAHQRPRADGARAARASSRRSCEHLRTARLHQGAHRRPVQVARGRHPPRSHEEPHDRSRR